MVGVLDSLTTFQSLYSFFLFNGGKAKATSKKVREKIPGLPYIPIGRVHIIVYGWRCCSSSIGYTYIYTPSSLFMRLFISIYDHVNIDEFEYLQLTSTTYYICTMQVSRQKYIYSHPFVLANSPLLSAINVLCLRTFTHTAGQSGT